jgi:hypothetical protein
MNTVQKVFNGFFADYAKEHVLCDQQQKVAHAIRKCHTDAMGTNVSVCEDCGHKSIHYNSCRNRHCPSCQGINKDIWADKRCEDAINAPYFHVVFTVPKQLHMLIYQNKMLLYSLMHKATAETTLSLADDKKYLGAKTGFFSVLHTWRQDLGYHPHIHIALVGGGLTETGQWRSSGKKFFIPVKVLAKLFRGKFLAALKSLYYDKRLEFFGQLSHLKDEHAFKSLLSEVYRINWYTYSKRAFSGPQAVVKYLAGYTHRIAIANSRILSIGESTVTFNVRDRNEAGRIKPLTLNGIEFIRRFLMHVLPKGFVKIRYYGILAVRHRKSTLLLCQKLTSTITYPATLKGLKPTEVLLVLFGKDVTLCPCCGIGKLVPWGSLGSSP